MAITTLDGVVAGLVNRKTLNYFSTNNSTVSGIWSNMQRSAFSSSAMSIPAAASAGGTLHTESEAGFFNLGSVTGKRYLAKAEAVSTTTAVFCVVDRLWSCSGLNGTLTTSQPITAMPALTRPDSTGNNTDLYIEIYTTLGTTAPTATISYTNSAGVSGRTAILILPVSAAAGRVFRVPLQGSDTGVRSVQSVTLSVSSGTAGNFGVTITSRVLTYLNVPAGVVYDFATLGLPEVYQGAAFNFFIRAASSGDAHLNLHFIDG